MPGNPARGGLNRIPSALLIALCSIAIIGTIIAFQTAPSLDSRVGVVCNNCSYDVSEKPSYTDKLFDPVSVLNLILAVSTVLLWLETKRLATFGAIQARDTKRAIRMARRSARAAIRSARVATRTVHSIEATAARQLRAYVGVHRAYIDNIDAAKPITIVVVLKNGGQTPAYKENAALYADVFDNSVLTEFAFGQEQAKSPTTLMPGAVSFVNIPIKDVSKVPQPERRSFILAGTITYEDVFGRSQYTNIRAIAAPGKTTFNFLPEGNDAS